MTNVGYTLIELALLLTLIAIITAIAVPYFTALRSHADQARQQASLNNARSAMAVYVAEQGESPTPVQLQTKLNVEGGSVSVNDQGNLQITIN